MIDASMISMIGRREGATDTTAYVVWCGVVVWRGRPGLHGQRTLRRRNANSGKWRNRRWWLECMRRRALAGSGERNSTRGAGAQGARARQCVYRARVRATHLTGVAVVRHSVREVPAGEEGERCRVSEEDRPVDGECQTRRRWWLECMRRRACLAGRGERSAHEHARCRSARSKHAQGSVCIGRGCVLHTRLEQPSSDIASEKYLQLRRASDAV